MAEQWAEEKVRVGETELSVLKGGQASSCSICMANWASKAGANGTRCWRKSAA
jgi:hypothetical protein